MKSQKWKKENIYFNLQHSHRRGFLQSLSQVEADLNEGFLRLECLSSEVAPSLPRDPLRVEVLRLLVVDELLQQLLVVCKELLNHLRWSTAPCCKRSRK